MTSRYFVSATLAFFFSNGLAVVPPPCAAGAKDSAAAKSPVKSKGAKADEDRFKDERISEEIPDTAANKILPRAALMQARKQKDGNAIRKIMAPVKVTALNKNTLDFWRGMAFKCEKRYEEAAVEFDKCTEFGDVSPEGQLQMAETYLFLEQCDRAIKILNLTIKGKPYFDCLELRGRCYLAQNKTQQALNDFVAATKIRKSKSRTLLARAGEILRRDHKPKEALEILKAGDDAKEHSTDAPFYMAKAMCYEDLAQWNEAVVWCSKAIEVTKRTGERTFQANQLIISRAILERAKCYDHLGKRALAAADRDFHHKYCSAVEDDMIGK